ncbi:hypothetical protein QYF50_07225 [Paenibacillus vini]|uniref:ATP-dependent DNA ligase n=1 Tax=Paenibacillus vini TaxID=1476024 RepID=UPI0025B6ED6B|nr:hypothetical protein [Paenibacillus vini]MDN4067683.1 hypothetical protein [Paenibacillus vini]
MFVDPMLVDDAEAPYESEQHIGELKIDGIRGILSHQGPVRLYTRHRNEITPRFQEIIAGAGAAIKKGTIIDGELVVCDIETGKPDFSATMSRFQTTKEIKRTPGLCFVGFDILEYQGKDTTGLNQMERKKILEEAISENDAIKRIRYMESGFVPLFELCRENRLEGIVIKRRDSQYYTGRRPKGVWQRVVVFQREECIVTGFSKKAVAWSVGIKRGDQILPAGLLKYGLNTAEARALFPLLNKAVVQETKDFARVEPIYKIGVRFRHWTKGNKMRLPVFERVII